MDIQRDRQTDTHTHTRTQTEVNNSHFTNTDGALVITQHVKLLM